MATWRAAARLLAIVMLWTLGAGEGRAAEDDPRFETVVLRNWGGPPAPLHIFRPANADADAPVVFVMHGAERDPLRYLQEWAPYATRYGFVAVAPEFSQRQFPDAAAYNQGDIINWLGRVRRRERWTYSAIEPAFDLVVQHEHLSARGYSLFGHSAGAQFVHRFMLLGAGPRAERAIAANAGWYTLANLRTVWPFGLRDVENQAGLQRALAAPLIVLVGDHDIDTGDQLLAQTRFAVRQGATRFERGQFFYESAVATARQRGVRFGWSCVIAPGVSHSNAQAAVFAAPLLFGPPPESGRPCTLLGAR